MPCPSRRWVKTSAVRAGSYRFTPPPPGDRTQDFPKRVKEESATYGFQPDWKKENLACGFGRFNNCGVEKKNLASLISWRSRVRVPPPLPEDTWTSPKKKLT